MVEKYFGYTEEKIIKIFKNSKDQVDTNSKLNKDASTLTQLVESSKRLLKENKDFLQMIYNELDE